MVEVSSGALAERRLAWMALVLTPGMGPTRMRRAVQRLGGDAERLFEASLTELEGLGMPAGAAQFVFDGRARKAATEETKPRGGGGRELSDARRMRSIRSGCWRSIDPPAVLWVRGDASIAGAAGDCGGGDAASFAVWRGDGGDAVRGIWRIGGW